MNYSNNQLINIYNEFCNKEEIFYDEISLENEIFLLETKIKSKLSPDKLLNYEQIKVKQLELQKLQSIRLIKYILKNYTDKNKVL